MHHTLYYSVVAVVDIAENGPFIVAPCLGHVEPLVETETTPLKPFWTSASDFLVREQLRVTRASLQD